MPLSADYRRLDLQLRTPEEFSQAVSGASLIADFLAPSRLPTRIEQFQAPGWSLDYQEAHVKARIIGPVPQGWVSLGFMRGNSPSSWYGIATLPGTLAFTPEGDTIDGHITPGFSCLSISLPKATWEQCGLLAGGERDRFKKGTVLRLSPEVHATIENQAQTLRQLLRSAIRFPKLRKFAARSASDFVLQVATTAWEIHLRTEPRHDSLHNRARLARRAEAWMRDHLSEPLRIPDLCLALRVSRRELEYAFRESFDESPRDYLHSLRLNAVHRVLIRPHDEETVLKSLLDHGLNHPGRFAADYKSFFGQSPKQTLRGRLKKSLGY